MRKDEKTADEEQRRTDEKKQADEKKRRTDKILEAALDYAKKGYRVFPVRCGQLWKGKPNYKISLISDWNENATTDEEQIRKWFGNGKPSNIGLVCDGLIVIDIDTKDGKNGGEGFELLTKKLGRLPDCPEAVTSTGGQHLFFRRPDRAKIGNKYGVVIEGKKYDIDIKTVSKDSEGKPQSGYVVAAPSIGENGEPYRLLEELLPKEGLEELPAAWLDFFEEPRSPRGKEQAPKENKRSNAVDLSVPPWTDEIDTAERVRRCENCVATVEVFTEGDGGGKLFHVCNIIYWGFAFDRHDPNARAILDGYLSQVRHNDGSPYPWTEDEIQHKINDVFDRPPNKPRGWLLNNPEYCNNTNDPVYKTVSDMIARLQAENARMIEDEDEQPTEREPYPIEYYPPVIRKFCENVAAWKCVDISVPGILVLTSASAAIGYGATLKHKDFNGAIRPIFHSAIVIDSGGGKSPVMGAMFAPHIKKNEEAFRERTKNEFEAKRENKGKKEGEKIKVPLVPPRIVEGTTIEGMQDLLWKIHEEAVLSELGFTVHSKKGGKFQKPGILWHYDEMAEMLQSMDAFKNGKGDSSVICTILDGRGSSTTRVDKEKNRYYTDCHVAMAGGIQGGILREIADANPSFFDQGLFQRINFVAPPFTPQKADSPGLDSGLKGRYDSKIGALFDIDERVYTLSSEAEAVYRDYKIYANKIFNDKGRLEDSKTKADSAIMSAIAKSKKTVLVIALILEILKDETQEDIISGETMEGAAAIAKFLFGEFEHIANYCKKGEKVTTKKARVYNAIKGEGGSGLSQRDIQQRYFREKGQGGKALEDFMADIVDSYPEIKRTEGKNGGAIYLYCP
ncbi:MAG: bifunctional DNA primase/polymerase [Thermoguttaceae bacterium]|nr:bifunctional DNA primase/polymerase [Thermoguttaceae bacterium]